MKEQILRLERHDDVNSARDKIGWTQASRVLLVWPPRGRVLTRRLDLLLLRRHAQAHGADLGIICDDPEICDHATDLGIPAFDSIEASRRTAWPRSARGRIFIKPWASRPKTFERPGSPSPFPIPESIRRVASKARAIIAAGGVFSVIGLTVVLFPSATVRLRPVPQVIAVTVPMVADPALEESQPGGLLPARTVTVELEGSARVATTGVVDVPSSKATGTVVFTNLIGQAVPIPAGTGVRTTSGSTVRFVTKINSSMPAGRGQTVRVPVEAVDQGPQGNVAAAQINAIDGPLGLQLAVLNDEPATGGDVQQGAAVTEADRTRLREELIAQLTQQAIAELSAGLGEADHLPLESVRVVEILSETYDRFSGERADTLGLGLRVVASGIVVDGEMAEHAALDSLRAQVGQGFALAPESAVVEWTTEPRLDDSGRLSFALTARGTVTAEISRDTVREAVRGRSLAYASQALTNGFPLIASPAIQIYPGWFPSLPWLAFRIDVIVESGAG